MKHLNKSLVIILMFLMIGCAGPPQGPPPSPPEQSQQQPAPPEPPAREPEQPAKPAEASEPAAVEPKVKPDDNAAAAELVAASEESAPEPTAEQAAEAEQAVELKADAAVEAQSQKAVAEQVTNAESASSKAVEMMSIGSGCPSQHFQNVQPAAANSAYPAPQLNVTCNGDTFTVQSNGIPNYEFVQITPNDLQVQNFSWQIPLNPQQAAQPGDIPLIGPIAVAVNGLPIFGPNEAEQDNYGDPYLDQLLDFCNGHTAQRGLYHLHARPDCIFENVEGNVALVIGYAFDGYPIMAPYICADDNCASVKKVQSSWQRTQNVKPAWEAHEYIAGSGDLDQCNGMVGPDGSYRYYATDTFPYFLGCYQGVANVSSGPGGQAQPQQDQQQSQQGNNQQGEPDFEAVAAQLGVSADALREALGPPPPDFAAAAAKLGVSEDALRQAMGAP